MMAMQKQIEEKESLDKAAEKIPNKGVRNQVQTFLDNPKEAGKMGAPATSPTKPRDDAECSTGHRPDRRS